MSISLTYLEDWLGRTPIDVEFGPEIPTRVTLPYRSKEMFRVEVPSRGVSISVWSSLGFNATGTHYVNCTHVAYLRLETECWRSEGWYDGLQRDCEDLLTLLVGEPVYPKKIRAYVEEEEITPGKKRREEVLIFGSLLDPKVREWAHSSEMPVPFQLIEGDIGRVFANWCSGAERFGAVHRLLLGTLYNRRMYLESEFLNLTQALETFHRRKFGGTYVPNEQYENYYGEVVKGLASGIPEELKIRLCEYLKYGNEYSLRMRFRQLLSSLKEGTRKELALDEKGLTNAVVLTRNYLTHYDESLKSNYRARISVHPE